MSGDHRRILATGIARLRAKIKYRPVVFELMPAEFTLLQLQRSVEALAGRLVHKQNFRRLIEQQQLVEETGAIAADTVGRPAKLFRFRHARAGRTGGCRHQASAFAHLTSVMLRISISHDMLMESINGQPQPRSARPFRKAL